MKPPEIIETARLILRPPTLNDAQEIFNKYAQDPEVTRYMVWRPHENIEMTKEFLERCIKCWKDGSAFPWVMTLKSDNTLLGMIEMRLVGYKTDLGYGIARQYWGKGYTTEAVKALVQWAMDQESIYRVWAACDLENLGSAKVLEKAGLQREEIQYTQEPHPVHLRL